MILPFLLLLSFQIQINLDLAPTDSKTEFENEWIRIVRVNYSAFQKTAVHDHPAAPTVIVYVTDGGRLKIVHPEYPDPTIRPPVKAGGVRYQKAEVEHHSVEEMDGVASEYLRVELKIEPIDPPPTDVRRPAGDRTPYESQMLRILRVTCSPHAPCPASENPGDPAAVITGRDFKWLDAFAAPLVNPSDQPQEQVRIELKAKPVH
jgi:hypothetical protein